MRRIRRVNQLSEKRSKLYVDALFLEAQVMRR